MSRLSVTEGEGGSRKTLPYNLHSLLFFFKKICEFHKNDLEFYINSGIRLSTVWVCINLVERRNVERKNIESVINAASAQAIHV
jgi:hypothetical protein